MMDIRAAQREAAKPGMSRFSKLGAMVIAVWSSVLGWKFPMPGMYWDARVKRPPMQATQLDFSL
jgi:hypothetical protein